MIEHLPNETEKLKRMLATAQAEMPKDTQLELTRLLYEDTTIATPKGFVSDLRDKLIALLQRIKGAASVSNFLRGEPYDNNGAAIVLIREQEGEFQVWGNVSGLQDGQLVDFYGPSLYNRPEQDVEAVYTLFASLYATPPKTIRFREFHPGMPNEGTYTFKNPTVEKLIFTSDGTRYWLDMLPLRNYCPNLKTCEVLNKALEVRTIAFPALLGDEIGDDRGPYYRVIAGTTLDLRGTATKTTTWWPSGWSIPSWANGWETLLVEDKRITYIADGPDYTATIATIEAEETT